MPRITRISGSLAIVLIAYWAYALTAVPLIEPLAEQIPDTSVAGAEVSADPEIDDLEKRQKRELMPLFRPTDWEVASSKTKILETPSGAKLLWQGYENLGGGNVLLKPCTIVFPYDGQAKDEAQRLRQSIILQAPKGAILECDRDLDIMRPAGIDLKGAQIQDKVTIRSDWKEPGPEDDLKIETSNIVLTKQLISTSERVEFRWGSHFGSGQDLKIKLLAGRPKPGGRLPGLDVVGIESFALSHIERLHLDLGQDPEKLASSHSKNGLKDASPKSDPAISSDSPSESTPIEITCRGSFLFNVVRRVAIFSDTVLVVRPNAEGNRDEIACELLRLWFIEKPGPAAAKTVAKNAASMDMMPERIEAIGGPTAPAVITAPSYDVVARAQMIEYNLLTKAIALEGEQPVYLRHKQNEIEAQNLHYQEAKEEGRLGHLESQGPGWLHGQSPEHPDQVLDAAWQDQLQIQRCDQYQQIALSGGAEVKSPEIGSLQAKKILLWLSETPSTNPSKPFELWPHVLTANENVHLGSKQVSGKVDQMEIWFKKKIQVAAAGVPAAAASDPSVAAKEVAGSQAIGSSYGVSPNGTTAQPSSQPMVSSLSPESSSPGSSQQHFEVTGRRLSATVSLEPKAAVSTLTIEDGVQIDETQTAQPGQSPIKILGDNLNVQDGEGPDATVTVVGRPAIANGQGFNLTGSNINVKRGANRLWIDGPGQMDLTITNDLDGRLLPTPSKLTVGWQESMNFNGRTAKFVKAVRATTPGIPSKTGMTQLDLRTNIMEVQLLRPVQFSEQKTPQEPPKVEKLQCFGGVVTESRTFDLGQQLLSHDRMKITDDLCINLENGEINGGEGWINTVRFGTAVAVANAPAQANQLHCLHVTFLDSITGNIKRDQMRFRFRGHVQTTFAPVDNWDAMLTTNDPNKLSKPSMIASCDDLSVFQMPVPMGAKPAVELLALGNVKVEGTRVDGTTFAALGDRMAYAQAKDMLTIEGNPAQLSQQAGPGTPRSQLPANKIIYWPNTRNVTVVGPQMLEMQLPVGQGKTQLPVGQGKR